MIKVLFVCLGNICRSPMAEGIFHHLTEQESLNEIISCDSCGTASYHVGEKPDRRTLRVLKEHGISTPHRARQITTEDFLQFDYLIAMDHSNLRNLKQMAQKIPNIKAKVHMMGEFFIDYSGEVPDEVPDPYYGHLEDFQEVYELLTPTCQKFLNFLREPQ